MGEYIEEFFNRMGFIDYSLIALFILFQCWKSLLFLLIIYLYHTADVVAACRNYRREMKNL